MLERIAKSLRQSTLRVLGCLLLSGNFAAQAQPTAQPHPSQFDPSDVYFQGYLAARAAEQLEASGDFIGAAEKLANAKRLFDAVAMYYPAWKTDMVKERTAATGQAVERVRPMSEEQQLKKRNVVAELEGGLKAPAQTVDPNSDPIPPAPNLLSADPVAARRLAEAEAEVKRLRDMGSANSAATEDSARSESRVRDIARQRDAVQSQLRAAETNLQSLRGQLASRPMENEMKSLNQRIAGLEQEREAMGMALSQSRSAHTEALSRTAILEADLKVMQQKHANLDRDLKGERTVANSVVAGQRTQLQGLEKELSAKSAELGQANERIIGLINELQESRDAFSELRTERDSLLQERDQMSAMLKLNEDGRINELIQQNMGLAKNLREANEKVERLNLDNNSTKDDITNAIRDLAIAKSQINKLHQEKRDQDGRLADLEKRLKEEESALAGGQVTGNVEEVAVLRDIIKRQLTAQKFRRQRRDQLIDAVKDMGTQDEKIAEAIQLFDSNEIELSPDEQRLLADKNVDGEFISPFAKDRATVGRNMSELNKDITVYERAAEKAFSSGRLLPTRELFQMILEQNPGHFPAICKLGVVHLKLEDAAAAIDTFRRAVELDSSNSYAQQMLGFSYLTAGNLTAAEENLKQAAELAPNDAKSHMLLGKISQLSERAGEAESHYKAAILADPVLSEPYYNLASLYAQQGRIDEARDFYHKALERGAVPDPELEQRLVQP